MSAGNWKQCDGRSAARSPLCSKNQPCSLFFGTFLTYPSRVVMGWNSRLAVRSIDRRRVTLATSRFFARSLLPSFFRGSFRFRRRVPVGRAPVRSFYSSFPTNGLLRHFCVRFSWNGRNVVRSHLADWMTSSIMHLLLIFLSSLGALFGGPKLLCLTKYFERVHRTLAAVNEFSESYVYMGAKKV